MPNFTILVAPAMVGTGYQIVMLSAHDCIVLVKPDGSNYATMEEAQAMVDSLGIPIAAFKRIEACQYCPL